MDEPVVVDTQSQSQSQSLEPAKRVGRPPGSPNRPKVHGSGARPGRWPTLTGEDLVLITRLHAKGRSCRTIARLLSTDDRSVSFTTIAAWLRRAKQPHEHIHQALASLRMDAVRSWDKAMKHGAKYGRHAPAKDLLIATGAIQPDVQTDRLVIIVGDGTANTAIPQLTLPEPIIDALPARDDQP